MTKSSSHLISCAENLKELVEIIEEYQAKLPFRSPESKLSFALPVHKLKQPGRE